MMFLYKRQPLHAQKIKKHKGQLQKHRETQHLEKAYPPPRIKFSSEKRTQSSINPL